MHLETDKMRLLKEIQTSKIEINSCEKGIGKYHNIYISISTCLI